MSPSPARKKPKKIPPQSDAPPKGHSELPPRLLDKRPGTSRGRGFLDLPPELRNLIYDFALHWPTSKELYAPYNRIIDAHYARQGSGIKEDFPKYHGHLRTPTILLLCRAITRECLPMLRERKLVIDRLPPWLPGALRPMLVSEFIGRRTFQNLRHIEIRLPLGQGHIGSGWVWVGVIDDILKILGERNQFKDLRVVVAMFNFSNRIVWDTELKHLRRLRRNVSSPPIPPYHSTNVA